jgi:nucleoside-diphosphate-sugar epimerase
MKGRLVVTGASGFVGRHVVAAAVADGWDVIGLVRSDEPGQTVAERGGRPRIVPGLEPEALSAAFAGAVGVVHLAQIGAERGGASYDAVNVQGTHAVLAAARSAGVERIAFFSGLGVARYGMARRCTNRYFLSKLAAETAIQASGLHAAVFRPSYVVGAGGELIPAILREIEAGEVERIGDGHHRLQPIAVDDAAAAVLASLARPEPFPSAFDLVGPEPLSYQQFVERVACVSAKLGRGGLFQVREITVEEADRQAAAGGYRGMLPDELDCLLCDEVADHHPLQDLVDRPLQRVDAAIEAALRDSLGRLEA